MKKEILKLKKYAKKKGFNLNDSIFSDSNIEESLTLCLRINDNKINYKIALDLLYTRS